MKTRKVFISTFSMKGKAPHRSDLQASHLGTDILSEKSRCLSSTLDYEERMEDFGLRGNVRHISMEEDEYQRAFTQNKDRICNTFLLSWMRAEGDVLQYCIFNHFVTSSFVSELVSKCLWIFCVWWGFDSHRQKHFRKGGEKDFEENASVMRLSFKLPVHVRLEYYSAWWVRGSNFSIKYANHTEPTRISVFYHAISSRRYGSFQSKLDKTDFSPFHFQDRYQHGWRRSFSIDNNRCFNHQLLSPSHRHHLRFHRQFLESLHIQPT